MADSILRLPHVRARTGLSRTSIYAQVRAGSFPRPIRIGAGSRRPAVGWTESSISEWIAQRAGAEA